MLSRRIFWLALVFFIPLFTLSGWFVSLMSPDFGLLDKNLEPFVPLFPHMGAMTGLLAALLFRAVTSLFLKKLLPEKPFKVQEKVIKPAVSRGEEDSEARKARDQRTFLYLLSAFQTEARLLDFFAEDLDLYEDDQIGAAVRPVHENGRKVLARYLDMAPVMEEEEGTRVTIPKGFEPSRTKLVGRVAGEPPFQGVLRHRGWRAKGIRMPVFSDAKGADILTPSEVEIL